MLELVVIPKVGPYGDGIAPSCVPTYWLKDTTLFRHGKREDVGASDKAYKQCQL